MTLRARCLTLSILAVAMTLGACTPTGSATATPDDASSAVPTTAPPTATPVEPGASGTPTAGQTETEWGTIWDAVPEGFPRYPGGVDAADATSDPVSAVYAIESADPAEVADWMQTSLELATYSTEALSGPLEDGSYVLDSVGDADCRIQTRVTPLGTMILVTVLYGADCPA